MDRVVPEGKNFTQLTVGELDTASRNLGESVVSAAADQNHPRQGMALALLAWLWAKRQDRDAQLETFTGMEYEDLFHVLGLDDEDEEPATPSTPAPA